MCSSDLGTKVSDEQVLDIFRKRVWPMKDSILDSDALTENHASTQAFQNYLTSPTIDGIRGTAWGAFNAVTEYTNHLQDYRRNGSADPEKDAVEARSEAVLFGTGQQRVGAALDSLLRLA